MRTVFVVNSGSSSIKYQLVDPASGENLASGMVERIGQEMGSVTHKCDGEKWSKDVAIGDHEVGMDVVLEMFREHGPDLDTFDIVAVGHRIVQGGSVFPSAALITHEVEEQIRELGLLAPLHNPAHLMGIAGAKHAFPDVPHVAVFDTSFFTGLPAAASTYAIPLDVAQKYKIRRYGAHGTSHQFVSAATAEFLGADPANFAVIVLHLGNGASVSAVKNGQAVETSMGLTPLEGLVMGTRSGDLDPAILVHLGRQAGMSFDDLDTLLNKKSGVLGLSGVTDMRDLHAKIDSGDEAAATALAVYVHRIKGYVGNYLAQLGHLDAIAFTAGIGENDDVVRAQALAGLEELGIAVDRAKNTGLRGEAAVISPDGAAVTVVVLPTNEELAIAREAIKVISA